MALDFQVGKPFPAFEFPCVQNRDGARVEGVVSNETLRGQAFVLWVYPKAQTSGCTLEAREFAALQGELKARDVEVLGVSRDGVNALWKFIEAQSLPFFLASDKDGPWLRQHGLIGEGTMYGKPVTKVLRTTFLVDAHGVLRHIWEKVTPAGHGAQVLEVVQSLSL